MQKSSKNGPGTSAGLKGGTISFDRTGGGSARFRTGPRLIEV